MIYTYVLGGPRQPAWSAWLGTLAMLAALVPSSLLGYFILRYNFLQIGVQRNLVYAVSAAFLALLYLAAVRRVEGWLHFPAKRAVEGAAHAPLERLEENHQHEEQNAGGRVGRQHRLEPHHHACKPFPCAKTARKSARSRPARSARPFRVKPTPRWNSWPSNCLL